MISSAIFESKDHLHVCLLLKTLLFLSFQIFKIAAAKQIGQALDEAS
jgi:hypothetical protein